MLKKLIIFFLIEYAYSYIPTNKLIKPLFKNNKKDGCYERFTNNIDNTLELKNIIENNNKYKLLNSLQNNQISLIQKLDLIEKEFETNKIKPHNIFKDLDF